MPYLDSLDYLNLNSLRRYPLREGCTARSVDRLFEIPDDFIVDASLCLSSDPAISCFISQVFNKFDSVTIQVSSIQVVSDVHTFTVVGSFEIPFASHTLNKTYYLAASPDYAWANGKITIGSIDSLKRQPTGSYTFVYGSTEFESRAVIVGMKGISSISFKDSLNGNMSLTGDITLRARNNNQFVYSSLTPQVITFDVGNGLGLNKACANSTYLKRINGIAGDSDGNISLIGLSCFSVTSPANSTLQFTDTCCTPCSGCTELATLTGRLTSLENQFIQTKNYYNELSTQLTTYLTTINSNCSC